MIVILATGPSMSQAVARSLRRHRAIAVSNAFELAPWAEALVSSDAAWWEHYQPEFAGRRFSIERVRGAERIEANPGWNSGALAVRVAREVFRAKKIALFGFDGHGTHYFGRHPELKASSAPLRNTNPERRRQHFKQHREEAAACAAAGVEVWNCTPGTAIDAYPVSTWEAIRC